MKKSFLFTGVMCLCFLGVQAWAQEHYTEGPVWRIVLVKVKPGKFDALMTDLRQHFKPIWEEEERQGVITDYKVYLNTSPSGTEDWNVAIGIQYKNFAALDGLTAKVDPIVLKHYGSREAMQEAAAKRVENGEVVASRLIREVTLK